MPERVISLAREISDLANNSSQSIQRVTRTTKLIAVNALVEAAHAGAAGKGFAVVANEVSTVSENINKIADQLAVNMTKI